MTDTELWGQFAVGVLTHPDLAAGATTENLETLWAWDNAETAPYPLMRWFNPQNTTEKWPGSRDSGAQPGARDVQIYLSLQDGINATVWTLVNEPYYGAIVANLRASLPRQQWGPYSTAGAELHAWGTGTAWLTGAPYFGAVPGNIPTGGFGTMDDQAITDQFNFLSTKLSGIGAALQKDVTDGTAAIVAAINAKPAGSGGQVDLAPVLAAVAAEHAAVDALTTALANDDADIDTALGNLSSAVADVKTHVAHLT